MDKELSNKGDTTSVILLCYDKKRPQQHFLYNLALEHGKHVTKMLQ